MRFVPESPIKTPSRIDVPGAALLTGGLVAFLLALTEGESWGWTSGRILGLFGIAAVLLVAWVLVELRVPEPMVDMRMMIRRTVLLTNITALISGFAMFSVFVLVPNFVEMPRGVPEQWAGLVDYGFGASATMAGLYLLPGSIVLLFAGPLAGRDRAAHRVQVADVDRDGADRHRCGDARDLARRAVADRGEPARVRHRHRLRLRGDGDDHRRRPCARPRPASRAA